MSEKEEIFPIFPNWSSIPIMVLAAIIGNSFFETYCNNNNEDLLKQKTAMSKLDPITYQNKPVDLDGNGIYNLINGNGKIYFGHQKNGLTGFYSPEIMDEQKIIPKGITTFYNNKLQFANRIKTESILGTKLTYRTIENKFKNTLPALKQQLQNPNQAQRNYKK